MPKPSVNVTIRMDVDVKAKADALFEALGIDMPTAINLFVKECLLRQGLPFEPSLNVPNQITIEAMKETNDMIRTGNFKRYTVDEVFATLKEDV